MFEKFHRNSVLIIFLLSYFQTGGSYKATRAIRASAETCSCTGLKCTCCVLLDSNRACLDATYAPKDLTLYVNILANGDPVFSTKIDSGNFPICAPVFPPVCWAFNRIHIDKDNVQVCSEVRIGPVPILKVPCLSYTGDNLIAGPNY